MPDNERAQESSGSEAAMDLLEGGIQGLYLGQRTVKSLETSLSGFKKK